MAIEHPPASRRHNQATDFMDGPLKLRMERANRHPLPEDTAEQCADCARQNGCASCFEELVRRFQSPLLHFLIRRTNSRHDAEDLLQETFLRVHRNLGSYQSAWRFNTWVFTIAHRLAISRKRRRRWLRIGFDHNVQTASVLPSSKLQEEEWHSKLWDDVRRILNDDAFTAVWFTYVESMPAANVGKILGRSANGVRLLLHRARKQLVEQLPGGSHEL
jgi:RNA polymerase sigma-70 factor (ECF subfamily)